MNSLESYETPQGDPRMHCLNIIDDAMSQGEGVIKGLINYFKSESYHQDYKEIANTKTSFTSEDWQERIYHIIITKRKYIQSFLNDPIIIALMSHNEQLFCNINDTQKVFFLINTPESFNQILISSGYMQTYQNTNEIEENTVLIIKEIVSSNETRYNIEHYPLLGKYYSTCESGNPKVLKIDTHSITHRRQIDYILSNNVGSVDSRGNINIDPRAYSPGGSYYLYQQYLGAENTGYIYTNAKQICIEYLYRSYL